MSDDTKNAPVLISRTLSELYERVALLQKDLDAACLKAGISTLATDILHNVGNILTSVVISGELIGERIQNSAAGDLKRANDLLRENRERLAEFLLHDQRGPKLLDYYLELEKSFNREQDFLLGQVKRLNERINAIKEIVVVQQRFSTLGTFMDEYDLEAMVEDALKIIESSLNKYSIRIERVFGCSGRVYIQRGKFLHVLVNVLKNAKEALQGLQDGERVIQISSTPEGKFALLTIADTGCGFDAETAERLFEHGYTTKPDGYGIGLSSAQAYMYDMGGMIRGCSDGTGCGSRFEIRIPTRALFDKLRT